MFDHVPDQRERWIRVRCSHVYSNSVLMLVDDFYQNYLAGLSAPKLSVHV